MMQQMVTRFSNFLEWVFAPRQPEEVTRATTPGEAPQRFSREEAYYWLMHAHW